MELLSKDTNLHQFLPSLAHIAAVTIVNHCFGDLMNDSTTLDRVYSDIECGFPLRLNKRSKKYQIAKRAREKLLFIPAHLRHTVYTTINGMRHDSYNCYFNNLADTVIPGLTNIEAFFRSDGTVDRIKVARRLVLNENVSIRLRFQVACLHYFEEDVVSLWREMEARGETQHFDTCNKLMVKFWVKWMQEGSRIPWLQALKEYFISTPELLEEDRLLIRPFFTLLQPKERQEFLIYFTMAYDYDDYRFCLYAATKEEKAKILEDNPVGLLLCHLNWPLQNVFLEVAEMVWHFLDVSSFTDVLLFIWDLRRERKDFDYCQLFLDFWNSCPMNLKEAIGKYSSTGVKINSILNRITNKKPWIRKSGRLQRTTQSSFLV